VENEKRKIDVLDEVKAILNKAEHLATLTKTPIVPTS
jgi:hypothetical protein